MTESVSEMPPPVEVDGSRYEIERELGYGGAGAVFLARDRETGDRVALKKLFGMDAKSVLRLKREFRALAGVAHPNLVKLYDMGRADDCWFLTMEYLDGLDLTTHFRAVAGNASNVAPAALDRLLRTLHQLAQAIDALHQTGVLHRDLKPSNVMVVDGRVVLLDFGLARALSGRDVTVTEDGAFPGTPAYMAPEQIEGAELDKPADWYAYGVIVYEALSGVLPIDGTVQEILCRKVSIRPAPLSVRAPHAPRWLTGLCTSLLARDPEARPTGEDVLAAFARAGRVDAQAMPHTANDNAFATESQAHAAPFFGRQAELSALWQALDDAEHGRSVVAHVRAPSGAGKSALVEHFLDELEARGERSALVLRSRCYEREAMPFKALDGVLDALVRYLARLNDLEVAQVLPHDSAALSQLFPVLDRLSVIKRLGLSPRLGRDAAGDRERAELALRQLLSRLAGWQPIVLWIDDLQWGDLDSARILRSWLREPMPVALLFVFSYRSDEVTTSSCLSSLLKPAPQGAEQPAVEQVVEIAPLGSADVRALCEQRLGDRPGAGPALVERITREAQGNPFLASQLATLAQVKLARGDTDLDQLSIDALVAQTSHLLPSEAQCLLEVLAVAGRPLLPVVLLHAAGIRQNGRALVHALRGLNLVRTREVGGQRMLEVYHDRVRERVRASLSEARRAAIHRELLAAVEFGAHADPDWLFTLALGAGRKSEALQYALTAAERSNASLAFERAAELYRSCIELSPAAQHLELWNKLALALVHCGDGSRAADAYLQVAKRVPAREALECKKLAAAHLLRSGRFAPAEQLVRDVLTEMRVPVPESDSAALASLLWERSKLKLRGLKYMPSTEPDPVLLAQHDVFYTFGSGLQYYDSLRAMLLSLRSMRCALDAGEPSRIARTFCLAAVGIATEGAANAGQQVDALLGYAAALASQLSEQAYGEVCAARAISAFMLVRFRAVLEPAAEAGSLLRSNVADPYGNYHRRHMALSVRLLALLMLGQVRKASTELQELLREAHTTENHSVLLALSPLRVLVDQARDGASSWRPQLEEQAQFLPPDHFGNAHVAHMNALMYDACASGEYDWAQGCLDALWPRFLRSSLAGSSSLAIGAYRARARLMLNHHAHVQRPQLLAAARQELKAIARSPFAHSGASKRIEARLAIAAGESRRAAELFKASARDWEAKDYPIEAARDAFAAGILLGGERGAAEQKAALERLSELGVVNPLRDLRAYTPELL